MIYFVFKGVKGKKILNYEKCVFLNIFLANGEDPDEMLHNVTFHLGLHCLPKYRSTGIKNENVKDEQKTRYM